MAITLEGFTLTHVLQSGPGLYQGEYRGYALAWQAGACDIWKGNEFIQTIRKHDELNEAIRLIDEWMIAP